MSDSTRPPGRPYFDAEGSVHRNRVLAAESADQTSKSIGSYSGSSHYTVAQAIDALEHLEAAIIAAGDVYGPGLTAALLGTINGVGVDAWDRPSNGRTSIARNVLGYLDVLHADADQRAEANLIEVRRLEVELDKAQAAYDEYAAGARRATIDANFGRLAYRYVEQLEAEIDRLAERWSRGHGKRVKARAWAETEALGPKPLDLDHEQA